MIKGLFAVGTITSSVMGGTYPAAGAMLGPALTFGYLAAKTVCEELEIDFRSGLESTECERAVRPRVAK